MATINYADKVAINVNPNIPEINKVTDGNMNLIKQVGNQILTTMGVYTDDWNSSTTYAIGDIVIYDNRIFRNLTGTNTETAPDLDTTNWEETTIAAMAGGADIPIRPTAPSNPQDDDLWIDTSDNAMSGANVLNEYSTSNQDVYSCDYTNNLLIKFNLSTITNYDKNSTDISTSGCTINSGSIVVAKNNDGSICKVYGKINITKTAQTARIYIANSGLTPESDISVNPLGLEIPSNGNSYGSSTAIYIRTTGTIELVSFGASSGTSADLLMIPFIIFVKGF